MIIQGRSRIEVVDLMAADLIKDDAYRNEADAVRCLYFKGTYWSLEVMRYVGDAMQRAFQLVEASVAMAMAEED